MKSVHVLVLLALLFFVPVACWKGPQLYASAVIIPGAIYNWLYGWPALSRDPSTDIVVLTGPAFAGLVSTGVLEGIALMRGGLKDK